MGIDFGHFGLRMVCFLFTLAWHWVFQGVYRELFFSVSTLANLQSFSNFNATSGAISG